MPRRNRRISDAEFQIRTERRAASFTGRRPEPSVLTSEEGRGAYNRRTKHTPDYITSYA